MPFLRSEFATFSRISATDERTKKVDGIARGENNLEYFHSEEKKAGVSQDKISKDVSKMKRLLYGAYRMHIDHGHDYMPIGRTCVGTAARYWAMVRPFSDYCYMIEIENISFPRRIAEALDFVQLGRALRVSCQLFAYLKCALDDQAKQRSKKPSQSVVDASGTPAKNNSQTSEKKSKKSSKNSKSSKSSKNSKNSKKNSNSESTEQQTLEAVLVELPALPRFCSISKSASVKLGNVLCSGLEVVRNERNHVWRGFLCREQIYVKRSQTEIEILQKIEQMSNRASFVPKHLVKIHASKHDVFCTKAGTPLKEYMRYDASKQRFQELAVGLLEALVEMQELGVSHNDISMKNIVITTETDTAIPTIIDFEMATFGSQFIGCCGTLGYISPEKDMQGRGVAHACDLWAMGIVLMQLYCIAHRKKKPKLDDWVIMQSKVEKLPDNCKWASLIKKMVVILPNRIAAADALKLARIAQSNSTQSKAQPKASPRVVLGDLPRNTKQRPSPVEAELFGENSANVVRSRENKQANLASTMLNPSHSTN